jgi:hypothetical protein
MSILHEPRQPPKGLGGWLILVAIQLFVARFDVISSVSRDFAPLLKNGEWRSLSIPGTASYHPFWKPLLMLEVAWCFLMAIAVFFLLVAFFSKSRAFPMAMIAFYLANLLYLTMFFIAGKIFPEFPGFQDENGLADITSTGVTCLIWIPYFLVSKRVTATFIEPQQESLRLDPTAAPTAAPKEPPPNA